MNIKMRLCLAVLGALYVLPAMALEGSVQRKLLPYLEVAIETNLDSLDPVLAWVSANKILFGTRTGFKHHSDGTVEYISAPQVQIYDTKTKKIEADKKRTIDEFSTYYRKLKYTPKEKCLIDSEAPPKPPIYAGAWALRSGHGCVKGVMTTEKPSLTDYFYIGKDGSKTNLIVNSYDKLGSTVWINWLGVYVLGEHLELVTSFENGNSTIVSTSTVKLLTPKGKLNYFDLHEYRLNYIRPTRAGIIAASLLESPIGSDLGDLGLYLWRDGVKIKVAEGYVAQVEIAANGCQVAYYHATSVRQIQRSKLRVIDVCEGFSVPNAMNPFKFK